MDYLDLNALTLKTYDRGVEEKERAYEAFELFRGLPQEERTTRNVAKLFGVSETTINKWRKRYSWKERVQDYDRDIALVRRNAEFSAEREAAKRSRANALLLQSIANLELLKLYGKTKQAMTEPTLPPNQVAAFAVKGDELERLAEGLPTQITQNETSLKMDLSKLTDKELKALKAMRKRLSEKPEDPEWNGA